MRRKAGIVVGVCAALVLAGSAGAAAWTYSRDDEGRPVGSWHEAPGVARTPVSLSEEQAAPSATAADPGARAQEAPQKRAQPAEKRTIFPESARSPAAKAARR